jgi:PAS domain S-box-containing protein
MSSVPFDRLAEHYLAILDALDQAVIGTDLEGNVIHWSDAAERLYGWSREEALGKQILDLTPTTISRPQAESILQELAAGTIWSGEFEVRARSGESFRASVTDVPLTGESGETKGVIGVSAPSSRPADLCALLERFAAACESQWPGLVKFDSATDRIEPLASEPHLIQLFALLAIREAGQLEGGSHLEIRLEKASASLLASLGATASARHAYIRIARRDDRPRFSLVRDIVRNAAPTDYAVALVRAAGGLLFEGALPNEPQAVHLLLRTDPK